MKEYIRSFIIGTSLLVVLQFYLSVRNISDDIKNYSYENYSLIAPLYFGLMNALSLFLSKKYDWTLRQRLLYASIASGLIVPTVAYFTKSYNFTKKEWIQYVIRIMIKHFVAYNVTIYSIEKSF